VNRIATPISLVVGVLAGVIAYTLTSSPVLSFVAWFVATGLCVLIFSTLVSRHPACQSAVAAVRSLHPDWDVFTGLASLRADEPDRYVVAVFYSAPDVRVKPPRYVLVALNRTLEFIELLPVDSDSAYFIRGRK
jgi:hypothetical protein